MINVAADTTRMMESLERAQEQVHKLEWAMKTAVYPSGYQMRRVQPDWEARLWQLTHDLAVRMSDRCQDGLMTPEQFGKLARNMAAWTVNEAIEATNPKPPTREELEKMFKGFQVQVKEPQK